MIDDSKLAQLKDLLNASKTIVVIVKDKPNLDQLATAASLVLGLRQIDKEVYFLTPSEIGGVGEANRIGTNKTRANGVSVAEEKNPKIIVSKNLKKNLPANTQNTSDQIFSQAVSNLAGLENLSHKMGNQNLVVSFDYSEEAVDKVSYHIGEESGKFFFDC